MALHKAAASNSSVEVVRLILDANPDAAKEKGKVSRGPSLSHTRTSHYTYTPCVFTWAIFICCGNAQSGSQLCYCCLIVSIV